MASAVFSPGRVALITGGASGVGFAFANLCQKHGMHIALVDKSGDRLRLAREALSASSKTKTETYTMDVSSLSQWRSLKSEVEAKFGSVDLLMLNAGASFKPAAAAGTGSLATWLDPDYHHNTYDTNVFGVLNGIAAFLPLLATKTSASAIVITGSKQGITNPPGAGNPAYNASKATLKSLAEHLAHDLRGSSPQVSAHLLIPGWTYTGFAGNEGPVPDEEARVKKPEGAWLASQVAEYGYKKMLDGKFYILCPDDDVPEHLDQARVAYAAGDVVEGRPALSRWHEDFKDESAKWIQAEAEKRKGAN